MNIIQFNEIIELLHSISDNSTANIIALVSVIISGIAVLSSTYFSVQTRKQYIDSSMYKDLKDAINKTEREEIKENTRDELGNLHIE